MKSPVLKFVTIPLSLFSSDQLTPSEKMVLMAIELHTPDSSGASIGIQGISNLCGISQKECKVALKSLYDKGAIETIVSEDGERKLIAKIYKEDYSKSSHRPEIDGVKPEPTINIDYDEVAQKWEEYCPMMPKIQRWSPSRKSKLRSSMKNAGISIDELYKIFRLVATSSFLNGSSQSEWSANFDWLIKSSSNLIKVIEGNYHNKNTSERIDYENIMSGKGITQNQEDSFYR